MTSLKELIDNKPRYMSDADMVKQVVENIELFQEVKISIPKVQAVYGLQRDRANVVIVLVNTMIESLALSE